MRIHLATAALAALLSSGTALAREAAELKRIDTTTVELTRETNAPIEVWLSTDTALDGGDRQIAKASKAKALRIDMPSGKRAYVILKDAKGEATVVGERLVPLAQGSNFRDLGGYRAANGKHIRWGMIYRSGATPMLTADDLGLVESLRLARMIDLRSNDERELAPTRITHVPYTAIGYSMAEMMPMDAARLVASNSSNLYRELPAFLAPHLKLVFNELLDKDAPLVYNCSAGQDRTGFVSAMILSALGVPRDTILADYHLSTAYRRPEFEVPENAMAAHPDNAMVKVYQQVKAQHGSTMPQPLKSADGTAYLSNAFAAIDQRWGSVEAYLEKEVGVDAEEIAKLRADYLE